MINAAAATVLVREPRQPTRAAKKVLALIRLWPAAIGSRLRAVSGVTLMFFSIADVANAKVRLESLRQTKRGRF
jgi:hypothetical protein